MTWLWAPWNVLYISMYEASKRRIYRWQLERLVKMLLDHLHQDELAGKGMRPPLLLKL